jgi:hypothetical protein
VKSLANGEAAPTPTSASQEISLLVLAGASAEVAIEAARVDQIVPAAQWQGPPGVDLFSLVGYAAPPGDEARMLVVRRARGELVIRAAGTLRMRNVERSQVLPLPSLLATRAPAISSVVLIAGALPLLIVDPDQIG